MAVDHLTAAAAGPLTPVLGNDPAAVADQHLLVAFIRQRLQRLGFCALKPLQRRLAGGPCTRRSATSRLQRTRWASNSAQLLNSRPAIAFRRLTQATPRSSLPWVLARPCPVGRQAGSA